MSAVVDQLRSALVQALARTGLDVPPSEVDVQPCADPRFGDFQSNAALVSAKGAGRKPRDIAQAALNAWGPDDKALAELSVAGPGFLNFRLRDDALRDTLNPRVDGPLAPANPAPRRIVIDFSSPNVAKSMHVGHIRSTVLGYALARIMRFLGHHVVTDNHIGDWGTQFGKLIHGFRTFGDEDALARDPIAEMERLYKRAHTESERDPATADAARDELRKLQEGDPANLALWQRFRALSQQAFQEIYDRLGITFDHTLGESHYNDALKPLVERLVRDGIARESEGAICVFFDEPELQDKPFLIQKTDGAALYSTTDLATMEFRIREFQPDAIWIVTDVRQADHFRQLFATTRRMGYTDVDLVHIGFGMMLGPDRKPFKSRSGDTIKLHELLDEAVQRARALVDERRPELSDAERHHIATTLGIASLKYADLVQNRHLDYVFDWDKLLAFDGNTAPYLLNAYVRIHAIFRKSGDAPDRTYHLAQPGHDLERALMIALLRWDLILEQVGQEQRPHHLCFYLFELAGLFHRFFEECPVLKAEPAIREHRLALCRLTARTLRTGCELLGLPILDKM